MLTAILRFELAHRLRQPSVWVFAAIFALASFGSVTSNVVSLGGGSGRTAINSPYVIMEMLGNASVFSAILVTAFVATAVTRDFELGTDGLFYTKPIRVRDYLLGRFFGAVLLSLVVMAAAAAGLMLGAAMPWHDPERLVAFSVVPYAWALLVLVLPTLLVLGAFFFALATLTRRVLPAYVGLLAFFVLYGLVDAFSRDLHNATWAAIADPFGVKALGLATRYWTVVERNTVLVPTGGALLLNRAVWLLLGATSLLATLRWFSFTPRTRRRPKHAAVAAEASRLDAPLVRVRPVFSLRTTLAQLWHAARFDFGLVLRGKAFLVITLIAVINVVAEAFGATENLYDMPVLPVTQFMVRVIEMVFPVYITIVITFYAGELVHSERRVRLHEVHDALPVPTWVPLVSKLGALVAAVVVLLGVSVLSGIGVQLAQGYTHVEPELYAKVMGLSLVQWALLSVLALFFQVLVNQKYLGFLLVLLYFISEATMVALDLRHGLHRFGFAPQAPYSDMNGFGHFLAAVLWYRLYWALVAAVLLVVAELSWVRGTETRVRLRLREARRRFTRRHAVLLVGLGAGALGAGAVILHQTTVLGRYRTHDDEQAAKARYEATYKAAWDRAPQPHLVVAELEVDVFPREREASVRGRFELVNPHPVPIDRLMVTVDPDHIVESLGLPDEALLEHDEELGVWIYRLEPALAPGATLPFAYALRFAEPGIRNHGSSTMVVGNGSFINVTHEPIFGSIGPYFGYDPSRELVDPNERRHRGLPPREGMRPPTDTASLGNSYHSRRASWVRYAATVSTSSDQLAVAPGELVREWQEGDRRFFRYEVGAPTLDNYAILSAAYAVARDRWNDVELEVYHHPSHDMNVPRFIETMKASLDYATRQFGPYQFRHLRVVEMPRYIDVAMGFPGLIPFSESVGFVADLRDPSRVDYLSYTTAHEVGHQWWAYQVTGGEVQGSPMLVETLAQYTALMVMEKVHGRAMGRSIRRHELDIYLQGRARELGLEVPMSRVEIQPYLYYCKGNMVMYALREVMGEDVLNGVLRGLVTDFALRGPPFTTAAELVERIRAKMPEKFAYLVEDLLETITLYDNRAIEATAVPLPGGRFRVDLVLESHKLRADGKGAEAEVPLSDWLQIGVMGEDADAEPLYLEWHRIEGERTELSLEVSAEPATAGVDPWLLFIDRDPDDNMRDVELRE